MGLLRKDEYEEKKAELESERAELRTEFVRQQVEVIPELRTLNGLKYKQIDDVLTRDLDDLERRWQVTRYIASQRKGKGSRNVPQDGFAMAVAPRWKSVDQGTYRTMREQTGKGTRITGEGPKRRFEILE